jgi:hypothetical protein
MLQTIHKHRKTLIGTTLLILLAVTLSGLGIGTMHSFQGRSSDFAVKVLRAALPTVPAIGQNMKIEGITYQINGLTDKPTSPVVILHVQRS